MPTSSSEVATGVFPVLVKDHTDLVSLDDVKLSLQPSLPNGSQLPLLCLAELSGIPPSLVGALGCLLETGILVMAREVSELKRPELCIGPGRT